MLRGNIFQMWWTNSQPHFSRLSVDGDAGEAVEAKRQISE